jgi:o-succinylbenzoate---CoA ligase
MGTGRSLPSRYRATHMPELIAIAVPGGQPFVDALRRVWDEGNAAFVLDLRLPSAARDQVLRAMAPSRLVTPDGTLSLDGGRPTQEGDALVVVTSGTTGAPKGAVLTHHAVRSSARATSERLGVRSDDQWLACLPLAHVGGLSVVTRALATDTPVTVQPAFDAHAAMNAARDGCTLVSLVATALQRIDPSAFRLVVLGGARPPSELAPNVVTTYGMTETGSGVVYDGDPLDGVEVRIDEEGQIWLRGPMLLRAYRDGSSPLLDGWLPTGDLGRWEPDGRLYVEGRAGDVIVTGGEKVWPDPVEDALRTQVTVADVAVAGRDDATWGQRVVAFVVPAAGSAPTLEALREHVKERLPSWYAPHELVLVERIPRTALGKIQRGALPR